MRFNSGFKGLNWRSDVDIRPTMVQEAFAKISAADFRLVPEGCCNGGMSHIPPPSGSALLSIGFRDAYVWGRNLHFSFRSATHPVGNTWRPVKFLHKSAEWLRNSHLLTKEQQSGMSSVYKKGGGGWDVSGANKFDSSSTERWRATDGAKPMAPWQPDEVS